MKKPIRSLGQALNQNEPSVREFLAAGTPKPHAAMEAAISELPSVSLAEPITREIPIPEVAVVSPVATVRKKAGGEEDAPEPLVSATFRLPQRIAEAMLRAATDRKIRRIKPQSQQEIVAAALEKWLKGNDYL